MAGRGGESACLGDERACRGSVCRCAWHRRQPVFSRHPDIRRPAVADELILPNFSSLMHPNGNQNVVDNVLAGAFTRLLTEKLAVSVDSSWIRRNRTSFPQQAGFGLASLTLKGQVFEDDPHEALVAASLSWGIGRLGNQAVGAGDRARSSRGFSSARVWATSPTASRGSGRLASRAPLQPNSRSVGGPQQPTSIRQPADLALCRRSMAISCIGDWHSNTAPFT